MSEEWRPVPGWEGFYEVSSEGGVRSVDRVNPVINRFGNVEHRRQRGQALKVGPGAQGYPAVSFTRPGAVRETRYVHDLVATAFLGPRPEGQEVCHRDGVKANCRAGNLRWGTRSSNALDRHEHGTMNQARGEEHFFHKLTAEDVRAIRSDIRSSRTIAADYGVHHKTILDARAGKSWQSVA